MTALSGRRRCTGYCAGPRTGAAAAQLSKTANGVIASSRSWRLTAPLRHAMGAGAGPAQHWHAQFARSSGCDGEPLAGRCVPQYCALASPPATQGRVSRLVRPFPWVDSRLRELRRPTSSEWGGGAETGAGRASRHRPDVQLRPFIQWGQAAHSDDGWITSPMLSVSSTSWRSGTVARRMHCCRSIERLRAQQAAHGHRARS